MQKTYMVWFPDNTSVPDYVGTLKASSYLHALSQFIMRPVHYFYEGKWYRNELAKKKLINTLKYTDDWNGLVLS